MKTILLNKAETSHPCIVTISNGRYGQYAKMNGLNYSIKNMLTKGYELVALSIDEINKIKAENNAMRAEIAKSNSKKFMKSLRKIDFTFENGLKIISVAYFKENSRNIGQETQGSDAHESIVIIDNKKLFARKHWSNNGIGIWKINKINDPELNNIGIGEYFGEIYFINNKVFLKSK